MKQLRVAENHHQVLPHWAEVRRELSEHQPFMVLTLDHHTDVLKAFRGSGAVEPGVWRDPSATAAAVARLHHDEQLDWAVSSGLASRAVAVTHVRPAELPASPLIEVRTPPDFPDEFIMLNQPERFRLQADAVFERAFLAPLLQGIDFTKPFLLDIDCDYVMTGQALHPVDSSLMRELASRALAVTAACERDYVRLLRLPGERIDSDAVLAGLRRLCGLD